MKIGKYRTIVWRNFFLNFFSEVNKLNISYKYLTVSNKILKRGEKYLQFLFMYFFISYCLSFLFFLKSTRYYCLNVNQKVIWVLIDNYICSIRVNSYFVLEKNEYLYEKLKYSCEKKKKLPLTFSYFSNQ